MHDFEKKDLLRYLVGMETKVVLKNLSLRASMGNQIFKLGVEEERISGALLLPLKH